MAKGVIGVPCPVQGRWSSFYGCLEGLRRPPEWEVVQSRGLSVATNRNNIVERALEIGAEHILWLDDDLVFKPDVLEKLLKHNVDIVVGLTLGRHPPFDPLWFQGIHESLLIPVDNMSVSRNGLKELHSCTSGGMLTRASIFKKVSRPWWALGTCVADGFYEDIYFCNVMQNHGGFTVWGDPEAMFGHTTDVEVWPGKTKGGEWVKALARTAGTRQTIIQAWPMEAVVTVPE